MKYFLALICLFSLRSYAGSTVNIYNQNILMSINDAQEFFGQYTLDENCEAIRLGRMFTYLSGRRVGPYHCTGSYKETGEKLRIKIRTTPIFLDDNDRPIDDYFNAEDVREHLLDFIIESF